MKHARFLSRCALLAGVALASSSRAQSFPEPTANSLLDAEQSAPLPLEPVLGEELQRRALALAVPELPLATQGFERQTSRRYAAFDRRELQATLFASVWVFPQPSVLERAALDAAARLLGSGPQSQLGRALLERKLAKHVDARLEEHASATVFIVYIESTPAARMVDLSDVVQAAVSGLASAGPNAYALERMNLISGTEAVAPLEPAAIRRAVGTYLISSRQTVVEFIPRNALDPAAATVAKSKASEASNRKSKASEASNRKSKASESSNRKSKASESSTRKSKASESSTRKSTATTTATKKTKGARTHAVNRGDTLIGIARRYKTSVRALVRANGIDPKRPIRLGQKLVIQK